MKTIKKWSAWQKVLAVGGIVLAVLFTLMMIGLGCGGAKKVVNLGQGGDLRQQDIAKPMPAPEAVEAGEALEDELTGAKTQAPDVPRLGVKAIKTGALTLEIKKGEYDRKYGEVVLIAQGVGGYVSDSRSSSSNGSIAGGTITIRIPNESFSKVMENLKKLGEVTSISEQAKDVTEEYVDLESRLNNLRVQEAVYLNLMSEAKTIEESITVQRELSVIQGQIEQLQGRKNYLDNHVDFSTIQITLLEPGTAISEDDGWGFVEALSDAAHGVVDGINEVVRFFGRALIYILIIAVLVAVLYFLLGKRRREPDSN